MRLETLAEDDDEDEDDDDDEEEDSDELEDVDEPDTDCIVSIVSDAIVLLLLVSIVKFELDMLDDECCFLFSFTPLCKVLQRV